MDGSMVDIKSLEDSEHQRLTGKPLKPILETVRVLDSVSLLNEIRYVVVPELLDNERNVLALTDFISTLTRTPKLKLIRFRHHGTRSHAQVYSTPSDGYILSLKKIAESRGIQNLIVGS